MIHHFFRIHGLPVDIVSERGQQFLRFLRDFCKLTGTTPGLSSGFHPQTNGQIERTNQKLKVALCCITSRNATSWSQTLPGKNMLTTVFLQNRIISFLNVVLVIGHPFPAQEEEVAVPCAQAIIQHCSMVWVQARHHLLWSNQMYMRKANWCHTPVPVNHPGQREYHSQFILLNKKLYFYVKFFFKFETELGQCWPTSAEDLLCRYVPLLGQCTFGLRNWTKDPFGPRVVSEPKAPSRKAWRSQEEA